jgi:hypothetical protein
MGADPDFSAYPDLEAFAAWMKARALTARPSGRPHALAEEGAVEILVEAPKQPVLSVVAFDEYGDARPGNPWLCLALVGLAFEGVEEEPDFERWARSELLTPDEAARAVYEKTIAARETFLARHGEMPDPFAPMDVELNAGAAQLLRGLA